MRFESAEPRKPSRLIYCQFAYPYEDEVNERITLELTKIYEETKEIYYVVHTSSCVAVMDSGHSRTILHLFITVEARR